MHRGQDTDSGGTWPTFLWIPVMACFPDEKEQEKLCMKVTTMNCGSLAT